jgi:hypothetical protein
LIESESYPEAREGVWRAGSAMECFFESVSEVMRKSGLGLTRKGEAVQPKVTACK